MSTPAKISFVVQSLNIATDVAPIKDKDGFYTLPGFVFSKASRNNKEYDASSMIDCITNPQSRFNRLLVEGSLHGEWGHPVTNDFSRLCKIAEDRHAIFISKVSSGTLRTGEEIIWVKCKGAGPYGKWFEEAMEDKHRNQSLSIRVACREGAVVAGIQKLYPKVLVTMDAVGGGGFGEASKRVALENKDSISVEEYTYQTFTESDITDTVAKELVFMENYNRDSVLEFFRADSIKVNQKIITLNVADKSVNAVHFNEFFL